MKLSPEQLKGLSREDKIALLEAAREKKRRLKQQRKTYKPNSGQERVHKGPEPIRVVTFGNGCWGKGTKFRMYDGSVKAVEDIAVGDVLMGPDSLPRTVKELYRGQEELCEINLKHSGKVVVNKSHILTLKCWNNYKLLTKNICVAEALQKQAIVERKMFHYRPEQIEYPEADLPIDPYILGTWLGDGKSAEPEICSCDDEVLNAWQEEANKRGLTLEIRHPKPETPTFRTAYMSSKSPLRGSNSFRNDLQKLGVWKNKHIPKAYLKAGANQRLELLAGLIDTDGSLQRNTHSFVQKNKTLVCQVKELAQSLGFVVAENFKDKGKVEERSDLRFLGDCAKIPVRVPRKRAGKLKKVANKERFTIRPLGPGNFYGFEVDGDNLVLLENYIVQHNSGKTTAAVHEAWWAAMGYNPVNNSYSKVPSRVVVLLDAPTKVGDTWMPGFYEWFDMEGSRVEQKRNGKPYIQELSFPNGSSIAFYFHQQEELVFEGIELDYLIADEPPPRHCWIGLSRGLRKKGSKPKVLFIGTPLASSWLYHDLVKPALEGERPDVGLYEGSTEMNRENLAEGYIEQFTKNLSKQEIETRIHGKWSHLEGLALAHLFKREVHVIDPFQWPADKPVVVAIDPHPAKDHVACMVGATGDGRLYYIKELASKAAPSGFAVELKEWMRGYRVMDVICDSLGETPGTGGDGNMSFSEKLRQMGVPARSTDFKEKSDADFIERIRQILEIPEVKDNFGRALPKLAIFRGNSRIIADIETVSWQKVRHENEFRDKLDISSKDFLACLKYAIATRISYYADTQKKPKIIKSKPSPWSGGGKKVSLFGKRW